MRFFSEDTLIEQPAIRLFKDVLANAQPACAAFGQWRGGGVGIEEG